MNRRTWSLPAVPLFAVAAVAWASAGHAQEVVVAPAQPPPAEPVATAPPAHSETVTERGGPSGAELGSGVLTLGLTYGAAAIVAAESPQAADHRMFIPVAGPWMALANRPSCGGSTQPSCGTETTYSVLIVADGIGQALGSILIVGAFLHPETVSRTTTVSEEPPKPALHLVPASIGSGYGLQALGTF
jgi:hypothetical protein